MGESPLLDALSWIGESLDKPGAAVRGLLSGRPDQLANLIPFSDTMGITDPSQRVSGRGLLENAGLLDPAADGSGFGAGDIAGMAAGIATDPLTYLPLVGWGAKAAMSARAAANAAKAASAAKAAEVAAPVAKIAAEAAPIAKAAETALPVAKAAEAAAPSAEKMLALSASELPEGAAVQKLSNYTGPGRDSYHVVNAKGDPIFTKTFKSEEGAKNFALDRMKNRLHAEKWAEMNNDALFGLDEQGVSPKKFASKFFDEVYPTLDKENKKAVEKVIRSQGFTPGEIAGFEADGSPIKLNTWEDAGKFLFDEWKTFESMDAEGSSTKPLRGLMLFMANQFNAKAAKQAGSPLISLTHGLGQ